MCREQFAFRYLHGLDLVSGSDTCLEVRKLTKQVERWLDFDNELVGWLLLNTVVCSWRTRPAVCWPTANAASSCSSFDCVVGEHHSSAYTHPDHFSLVGEGEYGAYQRRSFSAFINQCGSSSQPAAFDFNLVK